MNTKLRSIKVSLLIVCIFCSSKVFCQFKKDKFFDTAARNEAGIKPQTRITDCKGSLASNNQNQKWGVKVHSSKYSHEHIFKDAYIVKQKKNELRNRGSRQNSEENSVSTVTPQIGVDFEANWMMNGTPSDNSMAISNGGFIVTANNDQIEYYLQNGTFLYTDLWFDFFNDASLTSAIYDPKVIYDSGSDRFILVVLHGSSSSTSKVLVCFSKSNNPMNDGWWVYHLTGNPVTNNCWFDYPNIGISNNDLFITGNLFTNGNNFNQAVIYQMTKAPGYTGGTLNWGYYSGLSNSPYEAFALIPVSFGQQGNYGPGIYLVSNNPSGDNEIRLWDITDDYANTPVLNDYTISTTSYSPGADANQLGTSDLLDIGDCRIQNGFYLNGSIHFVFHSDIGSTWNGINYNRLNVSAGTNQSSTFGVVGTADYTYPSVASFSTTATDKSVMIAFLISSPNMYPAIRVINCDNAMLWSSSTLVKAGETYVDILSGSERWGDYSGASRKHNSSTPRIWLGGCYGANISIPNVPHTYKTWLAEVFATSTEVEEINYSDGNISVFPNPNYDFINVNFNVSSAKKITIKLINTEGQLIKVLFEDIVDSGDRVLSFNKNALSSGTFFVIVSSENKILKNEKVVILH